MRHTTPLQLPQYEDDGPPFQAVVSFRSDNCEVIGSGNLCSSCAGREKDITNSKEKAVARGKQPLKDKAPLTGSSKERLVATVHKQRQWYKELETKVTELEKEIEKNSVSVDETLERDIMEILVDGGNEVSPHMKLFWEQRKLVATPKFVRRYHPYLIRFCLSLHAKSPAAYRELRDSGVLVLPSERTLRDYRNFSKPGAGFRPEKIEQLKSLTQIFSGVQRQVVLLLDEMKMPSILIVDKHSN